MTTTVDIPRGTYRIHEQWDGSFRVHWRDFHGGKGRSKRLDNREQALAHARVLRQLCDYREAAK